MKNLENLFGTEKEPTLPTCKGLIFRGKVNTFVSTMRDCVYTQRMSLLRRKSCTYYECPSCDCMWDEMTQRLPIVPTKQVEHGQLYKLSVVNVSRDSETGYVDDWDLEFIKYKE